MGRLSTPTTNRYKKSRDGFRKVYEQARANQAKKASMTMAKTMGVFTTAVEISFQEVLAELNDIQKKLRLLEVKADKAEGKLDKHEGKLDRLEGKIDKVTGRKGNLLGILESKLDKMEGKIEKLADEAGELTDGVGKAEAKLDQLGKPTITPGTGTTPGGEVTVTPGSSVPGSSTSGPSVVRK